jgi:hypothetical protein
MKKHLIRIILAPIILLGCVDPKQDSPQAIPAKEINTIDSASSGDNVTSETKKIFTVRPGVRILFTETHPVGMSSSDVAIKLEGDLTGELAFRDIDPVTDILEADLDNNDAKEWYIITEGAGSGSYGSIKALTLSKDEALDEILIPDLTAEEGYQGHDQFSMEKGKLVRRFPVYKKGDENAKPTGGQKEILYTLIQFPGGKYALSREKDIRF